MESLIATGFLCLFCWLHGATVGIAVGSSDLYIFFAWTCGAIIFIGTLWSRNPTSRRIAASLTFLVCCGFLIALVKSITWFRTPKLEQWTALPDIGHDLLSNSILGSSTFDFCLFHMEGYLIPDSFLFILIVATSIFVWFHPQRLVILRRFFMIYATVTLARAIIAVVTYLPYSNPKCQDHRVEQQEIDLRDVAQLTIQLFIPAFIADKNGCRDILFNGRTILYLLCAMTWHTYYKWVPSAVNGVKLIVWIWVFLGITISLAQRMNYTLDVVLAGYFAITTWATYHRLANDVMTGQVFSAVWVIDKAIIYPVMEWMEAFVVETTTLSSDAESNAPLLYRRELQNVPTTFAHLEPKKAVVFRTSEL